MGGSKPTGKNKCATCKGSGTIEKEIEKTCPVCKGEGKKKNLCILCNRSISPDKQLCESCEVNPTIYQLIAPASTMTVEFNKIYTSKMVKEVTDMALQIFGGYGFSTEYPLERMVRDSRAWAFLGGTQEMLKTAAAGTVFKGK